MKTLNALVSGVSLLAMFAATAASAETMADIEAAAKKEGALTTIALPHDWCNYGEIIASFKAKYPEITVRHQTSVTGAYQSRLFRHTTSAAGCAVFVDSSL